MERVEATILVEGQPRTVAVYNIKRADRGAAEDLAKLIEQAKNDALEQAAIVAAQKFDEIHDPYDSGLSPHDFHWIVEAIRDLKS
jgi:hypothetical protein